LVNLFYLTIKVYFKILMFYVSFRLLDIPIYKFFEKSREKVISIPIFFFPNGQKNLEIKSTTESFKKRKQIHDDKKNFSVIGYQLFAFWDIRPKYG